jgi:hypothetical protein
MADQHNITMAVTGAGGTRTARQVLSWLVHVDLIAARAQFPPLSHDRS